MPTNRMTPVRFTKGHGTENDFILLPDPQGTLDLTVAQVQWLCDRRAGLGADGVIRVVPTAVADEPGVRAQADRAQWFMDYRNADGGPVEMCGNGTRVFAAYLRRAGWERGDQFTIATRSGVKPIRVDSPSAAGSDSDGQVDVGPIPAPQDGRCDPAPALDSVWYAVNLGGWRIDERAATDGSPQAGPVVAMSGIAPVDCAPLPGLKVNLGNPHTVVVLPEHIDVDLLDLSRAPEVRPAPVEGTNVEFVRPSGPGQVRMRVYERGVGETRSCGTGAAAAALALMYWAGSGVEPTWLVEVPGGRLRVRALPGREVELAGPAVLVADGTVTALPGA